MVVTSPFRKTGNPGQENRDVPLFISLLNWHCHGETDRMLALRCGGEAGPATD
jgi:hypothetical protein